MNCAICLESISKNHPYTPCGHLFHQSCLRKVRLIERSIKCPLCRTRFLVDRRTRSGTKNREVVDKYEELRKELRENTQKKGDHHTETYKTACKIAQHIWEYRIEFRKMARFTGYIKKHLIPYNMKLHDGYFRNDHLEIYELMKDSVKKMKLL